MDDVTRYSQCIATHADQRSASSERIWLRTVAVTVRDTHPHCQQHVAAGETSALYGANAMKKVSQSAVEARVRRALAREGEVLRKTRCGTTWAKDDLGDYFTVDQHCGNLIRWNCDLEVLAHEAGVMRRGEVIEP